MKRTSKISLKSIMALFILSIGIISCDKTSNNNPVIPDNTGVTLDDIVKEVNLARTSPATYVAILENMKQYFNGLQYQEPGDKWPMVTNEGVGAVNDAINDLKKVSGLVALQASVGITKACQDHVNDIGPKGIVSHDGTDGSSPWDRMNRYGKWGMNAGENISFGQNTARKIVLQLIIDDGVSSRGHRENILNTNYTKIGAAFGTHKQYGYMCVLDFAQIYTENK